MKSLPPDLLAEVTQRLVTELQPECIILFGSHAWGVPNEDSDVDLLVVLPGDRQPSLQDEVRAHRCLRGLALSKDILVESRARVERFRQVPASLESRIFAQGKVLYGHS